MININQADKYQILRLPDVMKMTGLSRSTIYVAISQDVFPKQVHLGPRSVGWLKREIDEWVKQRIEISRN